MITQIKVQFNKLFKLPIPLYHDSIHFISSNSPQTYSFNPRAKAFYPIHVAAHPFHLVSPSPWPFSVAATVGPFLYQVVCYLHELPYSSSFFTFSAIAFLLSIFNWFRDITFEATMEGQHTSFVVGSLRSGMLLFILSEVMFFVSFFWAFFYCSTTPSIFIGCIWPPTGIVVLNPFGLPYLNTLILLASGVSVTWAHRAMTYTPFYHTKNIFVGVGVVGQQLTLLSSHTITVNTLRSGAPSLFYREHYDRKTIIAPITVPYFSLYGPGILNMRHERFYPQLITITLGLFFTALQGFEYCEALFTINDSIYGSTFYMITGFHGFHVIIGTIFLVVCLLRYLREHFTAERHFGFEAAIWYWHFVDVVWLFVFISLYWWGGSLQDPNSASSELTLRQELDELRDSPQNPSISVFDILRENEEDPFGAWVEFEPESDGITSQEEALPELTEAEYDAAYAADWAAIHGNGGLMGRLGK